MSPQAGRPPSLVRSDPSQTPATSLEDQSAQIVGRPEVDAAIDAVGFEAKSHGHNATEAPAAVLNSLMSITRAAGSIGIPGLYVPEDPGASEEAAKTGNLSLRLGLGWAKSLSFSTGQTPVPRPQSLPGRFPPATVLLS